LAEHRLPYDVVFFLNRYFEAVGGAIQRSGGIANQYTGDGVMALFGVDPGVDEGCRHPLTAAPESVRSVAPPSEAPSPATQGRRHARRRQLKVASMATAWNRAGRSGPWPRIERTSGR